MPDLIVPPLLIGEDFAYDFFASVADAERYLEASVSRARLPRL